MDYSPSCTGSTGETQGSGKLWHPPCETSSHGSCCGTIKTFCMKKPKNVYFHFLISGFACWEQVAREGVTWARGLPDSRAGNTDSALLLMARFQLKLLVLFLRLFAPSRNLQSNYSKQIRMKFSAHKSQLKMAI